MTSWPARRGAAQAQHRGRSPDAVPTTIALARRTQQAAAAFGLKQPTRIPDRLCVDAFARALIGSRRSVHADLLVIWLVNLLAVQAVNASPVGGQDASVAMFALVAAQAIRLMEMWAEAAKTFDKFAMALSALDLAISASDDGFSVVDRVPRWAPVVMTTGRNTE
ncbi:MULTISPECIES: hypothetical protein [unclassified Streptomyces]|uniref:hypothetical protein n=1 Tax=unclassified Streptomyces TaxID=2593676 RepID=UPI002365E7C7|nr:MULTISPECIES: hypothetical protein [unclassified Streptomyces]MDF3140180.1 hypothetical protein [Streptomyces sp. T21Q-yed]WDF41710.1 hypothetical protein PBV52_35410 [Streptomyces sp. T12]